MSSILDLAHASLGTKHDAKKPVNSELAQWLSLARDLKSSDLAGLDAFLGTSSYLMGTLSLADAAIYVALVTSSDDIDFSASVISFDSHRTSKRR